MKGHRHFFLRLPSNAFPDIGSVGRIEKKKLKTKQNKTKQHKKSRNSRSWYPRTKENVQYTVKNVHVFVPVFLYAITMLIFQIKRIISSEKWCNYVVTFFFFNAKNLGRSDDGKRRKRRRWLDTILKELN